MKLGYRMLVLVLSAFVLAKNEVRGVTADPRGNPYEPIVGRNVFSLKPPTPPPNPEDLIKKEPPPKIKLQGLTTILGRRQVLFKVQAAAKPGTPAKEEAYVLSEGERQGEVEVLEIDEQAGTIKFKNHGIEQALNMKDDADKPVVGAVVPGLPQPGPAAGALPGVPPPTAAFNPAPPAPGNITTFGGKTTIPPRPVRASPMAGGMPAGTAGAAQAPQAMPYSREEQVILMEVQRKQYENDPTFPPLPPTELMPNPPPPPPLPE